MKNEKDTKISDHAQGPIGGEQTNRGESDSGSNETAESTDNKNAPGAFAPQTGVTNQPVPDQDGRIHNGADTGPDGT